MRILSLVFVLALAASPALAAEGHDPTAVVQHIFEVADEDGNGSLSRAEYEAAGLQNFGVSFGESDTNSDGETSLEEYLELYQRHHPPRDRAQA